MLGGTEVKALEKFAERTGIFFTGIMRRDWENIFHGEVVQTNFSISYHGMESVAGDEKAYLVYFVNKQAV